MVNTKMRTATGSWVKRHGGAVLMFATGGALLVSLIGLSVALLGPTQESVNLQVNEQLNQLRGERDAAVDELQQAHAGVVNKIPGVTAERIAEDTAAAERQLLAITSSSATTRDLAHQQQVLDAQLDLDSKQPVSDFLPMWMHETQIDQDRGATYRLNAFDTTLVGVLAGDYTYTGVAALVPLTAAGEVNEKLPSQHVAMRFSTAENGDVKLISIDLLVPRDPAAPAAD